MEFRTFEELESYLRRFMSWENRPDYDFGGAVSLLGACLDSLRERALDHELEELPDRLSDEQTAFLLKCASLLQRKA